MNQLHTPLSHATSRRWLDGFFTIAECLRSATAKGAQ